MYVKGRKDGVKRPVAVLSRKGDYSECLFLGLKVVMTVRSSRIVKVDVPNPLRAALK